MVDEACNFMHSRRSLFWIFALVSTALLYDSAGFAADQFQNIQHDPDAVSAIMENNSCELKSNAKGIWSGKSIEVRFRSHRNGSAVELSAPNVAIKSLQVHWNTKLASDWKYLGDAWERAYGDLEWKTLDGNRIMPWYFWASDSEVTHSYGVITGPAAMCHWTAEENGITLHGDVCCGGIGVQLGNRKLGVSTVVDRRDRLNETPFVAAQSFCNIMCPAFGIRSASTNHQLKSAW